jgi:tetratricopeptide (TPR) repeat protein
MAFRPFMSLPAVTSRALLLASFLAAGSLAALAQSPATPPSQAPQDATSRRADAYFYFMLGHFFEEQYEGSGRSDDANQAIENFKKAYALDPSSPVIGERLAEMYYKAQRIRDAVLELQEVIRRSPENLSARRLLARIYLRTMGRRDAGGGSSEIARRAAEVLEEIVRLDPADIESAQNLGRLYRMQGETAEAERVLRRALQQEPYNNSTLRQLSALLLEQNRAAEAMALLEPAAARAGSAELLLLLGDAATQNRDYPRAEAAYRNALGLDPASAESRRKLAEALAAQFRNDEAVEQYEKLIESEPAEADHYLRLAQLYRRLRRLNLAEAALLQARQRAPGNLEVQYHEALLYEDQGRLEDAIRVMNSAISMIRSNPARATSSRRTMAVLLEQLGRLYRETGNFNAAVNTFRDMQSLDREYERRARMLIADTYRESKELGLALDESARARELFPDDRSLALTHAMLLGEKGDVEGAVALVESLRRGDASDRELQLSLAQIYERNRRFEQAERAVENAVRMAQLPAENEAAWLLLGGIYERQKKYDLAEEQFRKGLELNPRNAQVLNYYGYMLAERGVRLEEAVALVRRALDEEPSNGAYLDSLGWAYFKQGNFEGAEENLRRAAARVPRDPTVLEHLGDLFFKTGRLELAAEYWEKSIAEWQRALPAEREPERMAEVEAKLGRLKHRVAQKPGAQSKQPD